MPPDVVARFADSPNRLVATTVVRRERLSPGFVRVGLTGPGVGLLADLGRDLRVKILLPGPDGYPASLGDGSSEAAWRAAWRGLPAQKRPVMRSYTAPRIVPEQGTLDLDFFLHDPAGPASRWAARARAGDPLLVSAPEAARAPASYGVQWAPGPATRVLVGADETAFPAVAGILASLGRDVRATVLLECGDPADVAPFVGVGPGASPGVEVRVLQRGARPGGVVLLAAVREWAERYGAGAAAAGAGFYAWCATESARVAEVRRCLLGAGLAGTQVHTQGYWIDRSGAARHPEG